jgi:hypothetical protein
LEEIRQKLSRRFCGIYETPQGRLLTRSKAARFLGVSRALLLRYTKQCYYLPEGKLRFQKIRPPRIGAKPGYAFLESDLVELRNKLHAALASGYCSEKWKDAAELVDHFEICELSDRLMLGTLLREWRLSGALCAQQITRNRTSKRVWIYDVQGVDRLLHAPGAGASQGDETTISARLNRSAKEASSKTRRKVGRPRDPETEEVYKFCFHAYTGQGKLATATRQAQNLFGTKAPKTKQDLRRYAKRYAARHDLPCNRQNT